MQYVGRTPENLNFKVVCNDYKFHHRLLRHMLRHKAAGAFDYVHLHRREVVDVVS